MKIICVDSFPVVLLKSRKSEHKTMTLITLDLCMSMEIKCIYEPLGDS